MKKKILNRTNGFTVLEMIIVVILLGVIASFAIPNFDKADLKAHEKMMADQLHILETANKLYKARNGTYLSTGGVGEDQTYVNTNLNIHLALQNYSFTYRSNDGSDYTSTTDYKGIIELQLEPITDSNVDGVCCVTTNCAIIPDC